MADLTGVLPVLHERLAQDFVGGDEDLLGSGLLSGGPSGLLVALPFPGVRGRRRESYPASLVLPRRTRMGPGADGSVSTKWFSVRGVRENAFVDEISLYVPNLT